MAEIMGRREKKKLQSKHNILGAAVKQFMAKGVRETSIADIMSEAELGIGTFYNYFESKEALLLCLLDQIVEDTRAKTAELIDAKAPAPEMLEAIVMVAAEELEKNRFVLPLFLSAAERSSLPRKKAAERPSLAPAFRSVFAEAVRYGQARGEFRADIPADIVTEMFHSIFQAASFSSLRFSFTENIQMKIRLLLGGLRPRS